jgi:hypothetical protein
MFKRFLFISLIIFHFQLVFAQKKQFAEIELISGNIWKGEILERNSENLKLRINGGHTLFIKVSEIKRETKIDLVPIHNLSPKTRGFGHFTELGPLAMSNRASNGVTTSAFSLQVTNGYYFDRYLFLGLGLGADLYAVQTFVPVLLSARGDLSKKAISKIPFYFLEGGYSINATSNDLGTQQVFKGGATWSAGLGYKILFNQSTGFIISAGYRYQLSREKTKGLENNQVFNRLSLRAGFTF